MRLNRSAVHMAAIKSIYLATSPTKLTEGYPSYISIYELAKNPRSHTTRPTLPKGSISRLIHHHIVQR